MKKYKNLGRNFGVILNGKTLDFENGEIKDLPDNFKENIQDHLNKIVLLEEKAPIEEEKPKATGAKIAITADTAGFNAKNILKKNVRKLRKVLKKGSYSQPELRGLLDTEEKGKNRKFVVKRLKRLIE